LTKSANAHYLKDLPTSNVVVTFSLNPQKIADIFEGWFPDGLRITPSIDERLNASRECGQTGFETRWRIDPIIPVEGWQSIYREFFEKASGFEPKRITLGIYRQMGSGLKVFSQKWGLQPMNWQPTGKLVKDMGSHLQLPRAERVKLYSAIREMVEGAWPPSMRPELALCKEIGEVRSASGIPSRRCNCE